MANTQGKTATKNTRGKAKAATTSQKRQTASATAAPPPQLSPAHMRSLNSGLKQIGAGRKQMNAGLQKLQGIPGIDLGWLDQNEQQHAGEMTELETGTRDTGQQRQRKAA